MGGGLHLHNPSTAGEQVMLVSCVEGGVWSHTTPAGNMSTEGVGEGTHCYPDRDRCRIGGQLADT